eukprot:scaffold102646_cov31-Tisochrysis_lutea.AAC.1
MLMGKLGGVDRRPVHLRDREVLGRDRAWKQRRPEGHNPCAIEMASGLPFLPDHRLILNVEHTRRWKIRRGVGDQA